MAWHRKLFNLIRPNRLAADIDREMDFHLAELMDELMGEGMSEHEARREAKRRFGNRNKQREDTFRADILIWLESVLADLKYAFRGLRKSPGFTLVAVASLALGIGANTAIFSLLNALVFRTLPVQNPDELVQVTFGIGDNVRTSFTNPLWEELQRQQDALSGAFAFSTRGVNLATGGEVRQTNGYWVSGGFFSVLGVRPVVGRTLLPSDDYRGCPGVVAVSHAFWERELSSSPEAVGQTVMLDGHPFEVVGVVDPRFTGVNVGQTADIYTPLCSFPITSPGSTVLDARSTWFLNIIGRPADGLSVEQVGARLAMKAPGIFGATVPQHWDTEGQERYRSYSLDAREAAGGVSVLRNRYEDALYVLMAIVGAVLLIACANVANLLMARASQREHEVAIRRAIGSGRARLARQLVTESLVLSIMGAAVGIMFAQWASGFLVTMLTTTTPLWLDLSLDLRVLGFTIGVATLTGLLFGLAPAWKTTGVAPQLALRGAGRTAGQQGRVNTGRALVVGQLALSMSLVVGAGLLVGSLIRLTTFDVGFEKEGVLIARLDTRNAGFSDDDARMMQGTLVSELRALPGVASASASRLTPIGRSAWNEDVEVDGFEPSDDRESLVWMNSTTDDFFRTLGTPLLAGRDFTSDDVLGSAHVAIVNETMARRFYSDPRPVGRTFRKVGVGEEPVTYEIVGVVKDTKYSSIDEETHPIAYMPLAQEQSVWNQWRIQVRTTGAPTSVIPQVTEAIERAHPSIAIRYTTLEDDVAISLSRPTVLAVLSAFFGGVALLLAMIGLYGTLAYRVTSRQNEIGVRLALGATRQKVVRMVLKEVSTLVLAGITLGVIGALAGTRLLQDFLFGLGATDPATMAIAASVLGVVALVAAALPAWRAARLDPMAALREE